MIDYQKLKTIDTQTSPVDRHEKFNKLSKVKWRKCCKFPQNLFLFFQIYSHSKKNFNLFVIFSCSTKKRNVRYKREKYFISRVTRKCDVITLICYMLWNFTELDLDLVMFGEGIDWRLGVWATIVTYYTKMCLEFSQDELIWTVLR